MASGVEPQPMGAYTLTYTIQKENCNYTYGPCTIRLSGNVVEIQVSGIVDLPNGSSTIITVPDRCKPKNSNCMAYDQIVSNTNNLASEFRVLRSFLATNGEFSLYNYGTSFSNSNCVFKAVFILD